MKISSIKDRAGFFAILELDRTGVLAELLFLNLDSADNLDFLKKINTFFLDLSKDLTAIVFDPVYSLDLIADKADQAGSLIRLEQHKEFSPNNLPELFPNFSLEEVKNNYSLAKLELFYHPREKEAMAKKKLLAEIKSYCNSLGIDFLLKLKIYDYRKFINNKKEKETEKEELTTTVPAEDFSYEESQLTAIQELRSFVKIFALEAPEDPLLLATISTELDFPWIVFTEKKLSYEDFKEQFRMAVENGASGYLLGDLLWTGIESFKLEDQNPDLEAIENFIKTTVRDRVLELNRIVLEILTNNKE